MPVDPDALRNALRVLSERVTAEVRAAKLAGEVQLRRQQYLLRPDFSLLYTVDPTIRNFEPEAVEEEEWYWKDEEAFIGERVVNLAEHTRALQLLEETGHQGPGILRSFVWRAACDAATSDAMDLGREIETALRDFTGGPWVYHIKLWLTGITVTEDAIQVSDSLRLRRPTRVDVQEKVRTEALPYAHALRPYQIHFSCVADYEISVNRPIEVQQHVDRLITGLRLFRLGSVSAPRQEYRAESFSPLANSIVGGQTGGARLLCEISASDAPELSRALRVLIPLVRSSCDLPKPKPDFLSTALQRYAEALLAGGPIEGAVASAVACLEALFLGDNPQTELSYRLAQRVIALLRCFGWPPLEMRKCLTLGYAVRSKYVHGANPVKLTNEELNGLFRRVAEYARASCSIWTQLSPGASRKEVLTALDEALIDDAARTGLQERCDALALAQRPQ